MDKSILTDLVKEKEEASAELPILEEMMKAGLFLGRRKSKTHPRMKPYIFTTRNGIEVVDLTQTLQAIDEVVEFVKSKVTTKQGFLLVGTTPAAKNLVEEFSKKNGCSYVNERWLGGILTNYKTLSKRINYFKKLKADRTANRFDKRTKKERLDIDREIDKLAIKFSGVENMERLPEIVFVIDATHHMTAIREAKRLNIPVAAMANTDINPEIVNYPIPSNDRSRPAIEWILNRIEPAISQITNKVKEAKEVKKND